MATKKVDETQQKIAETARELVACFDAEPGRAKQLAEELLALLPDQEES